MSINDIINGILNREGEGVPPYLVPGDDGGRTSWGISERFHPEAWVNGPPTRDQAFRLYRLRYVAPFESLLNAPGLFAVGVCAVDDGVLSGVPEAIKRLQWVLHVPMDGILGGNTLFTAGQRYPNELLKAYVVERATRLARSVEHDHDNATFIVGWITRALSFLP